MEKDTKKCIHQFNILNRDDAQAYGLWSPEAIVFYCNKCLLFVQRRIDADILVELEACEDE